MIEEAETILRIWNQSNENLRVCKYKYKFYLIDPFALIMVRAIVYNHSFTRNS